MVLNIVHKFNNLWKNNDNYTKDILACKIYLRKIINYVKMLGIVIKVYFNSRRV